MKTISEIRDILVDYVNESGYKFGIGYDYSLGTLQDLLDEIKEEFENLEVE